MKIWIDLSNSPHVPLFSPIAEALKNRGHTIVWTARDFAQTIQLVKQFGINAKTIGSHGGAGLFGKGTAFTSRAWELRSFVRNEKPDLYLGHNSHEPLLVARLSGIKSVNMMDYEHHPMNRLSFRLAGSNLVPEFFPDSIITKFGAKSKTRKYIGIKEDIYLSGFAQKLHSKLLK